jgi:ABC-type glycerol-3-phosphate transport system permease component
MRLAAYSLARLERAGKKKSCFVGILATMLIPVEATMVPALSDWRVDMY